MPGIVRKFRNKAAILGEVMLPFRNVSFSQHGEDILVETALHLMGITVPFYVDIGTNHPIRFSNTYRFYRHGHHGACVEPNPILCEQIRKVRPRDRLFPVGIGAVSHESMTFFRFDNPGMSTFSESQATEIERSSPFRIVERMPVEVLDVNSLFKRLDRPVDFLSVDCEGLDLEILNAINFDANRPAVICVESALPAPDAGQQSRLGAKMPEFTQLLNPRGYWCFADTYVNSIFVDGRRLSIG